jgi:Tol biopolymer transport system component
MRDVRARLRGGMSERLDRSMQVSCNMTTNPTAEPARPSRRSCSAAFVLVFALSIACATAAPREPREPRPGAAGSSDPACTVKSFTRVDGQYVWSPDGSRYLVNKKDASGTYQLYVSPVGGGDPVCISCTQKPNSPLVNRHKLQPHWYPTGDWIVLSGEWTKDHKPFWAPSGVVEGWVASGLWVDIYITRPDGSDWHRLVDFENGRADGFTGVAFTRDGQQAVWAQIVDGNVFRYTFGKWELILADVQRDANGVLSFVNQRNITPAKTNWIETGNFAPDGHSLIVTADTGLKNAMGMDQFVIDIDTGRVRNLTNQPDWWDEHGRFSPDGRKVVYMSSSPFRDHPLQSNMFFLHTEFMLMNSDGSGQEQLSHFNSKGYPESNTGGRSSVAAAAEWNPDGRSISLMNLFFPNYEAWIVTFTGNCGAEARQPPGRIP